MVEPGPTSWHQFENVVMSNFIYYLPVTINHIFVSLQCVTEIV